MTDAASERDRQGHHGTRRDPVPIGVVLGMAGAMLAVAFKARCGIPPTLSDAFGRACYSDIVPLWFGRGLDTGAVPYLDTALEYPPLTGLWLWGAALPSSSAGEFFIWTSALLVVAAGVIGGLLAATVGVRRTLVFAAAPTLVVSGAVNWDLPSMALATAGLVAHRRGRDGWAGTWLGLGAAAKLWPALLLVPVVFAAVRTGGRRAAALPACTAAAAWAAANLPVALAAPSAWWEFFALSRERPPTVASLWGVLDGAGVELDPALVNGVSAVLVIAGAAVLLVLAARWDPPDRMHLVALPLLALFLLTNKVYSPQFTLWLLPLLALSRPPLWSLAAVAVTDVAVNVTEFAWVGHLKGEDMGSLAALRAAVLARAVAVAVTAVLAWRRAAREAPHTGPDPRPRMAAAQ